MFQNISNRAANSLKYVTTTARQNIFNMDSAKSAAKVTAAFAAAPAAAIGATYVADYAVNNLLSPVLATLVSPVACAFASYKAGEFVLDKVIAQSSQTSASKASAPTGGETNNNIARRAVVYAGKTLQEYGNKPITDIGIEAVAPTAAAGLGNLLGICVVQGAIKVYPVLAFVAPVLTPLAKGYGMIGGAKLAKAFPQHVRTGVRKVIGNGYTRVTGETVMLGGSANQAGVVNSEAEQLVRQIRALHARIDSEQQRVATDNRAKRALEERLHALTRPGR